MSEERPLGGDLVQFWSLLFSSGVVFSHTETHVQTQYTIQCLTKGIKWWLQLHPRSTKTFSTSKPLCLGSLCPEFYCLPNQQVLCSQTRAIQGQPAQQLPKLASNPDQQLGTRMAKFYTGKQKHSQQEKKGEGGRGKMIAFLVSISFSLCWHNNSQRKA